MSFTKLFHKILFVLLFSSNTAYAVNSITIENTWSPDAPPVVKVMAGYMLIKNNSSKDVKIISAKSPLFKRVEVHLSEMKNGMMSMTKQENLNIKAKNHIELKSGGLHMMLMGKLKPITKGENIPVALTFDNGDIIKINLKVKTHNEPEMKCGSMMKHH